MSGRKRSEVQDLLRSGMKIRETTNSQTNEGIESYLDNIEAKGKALEDHKKKALHELSFSEAAKDMFPEEAAKQSAEYKALQKMLSSMKINSSVSDDVYAKLDDLDDRLAKCDDEADAIRKAIAHKSDYCDREYARAGELKAEYKQLADERAEILNKLKKESMKADAVVSEAKKLASNIECVENTIRSCNTTAENRVKADSIKNEMAERLKGIEKVKDFAVKFFAVEYADVKAVISSMQTKSDAEIIAAAPEVMTGLNRFVQKLDNRIAEYFKQKQDAEDMKNNADAIAQSGYVEPLAFLKGESTQTNLFTYLNLYIKNDYEERFNKLIAQADCLFQKEDFINARNLYEEAYNLVDEAAKKASELQDSVLKKADLAFTIRDVMYDQRYDVDVQSIDGNPNNGYKVTCTIGDEIIDFTKIDIGSDGKPVIEIDHTESRTGNCGASIKAIAEELRYEGIVVNDIYKVNANGEESVLYPERRSYGADVATKDRSRH